MSKYRLANIHLLEDACWIGYVPELGLYTDKQVSPEAARQACERLIEETTGEHDLKVYFA